ncbi:hypothetical protein MW887_009855 [Aspergillus wentii]|nr:hypothetical protein MW887_009855 [Aspergillus wentii]
MEPPHTDHPAIHPLDEDAPRDENDQADNKKSAVAFSTPLYVPILLLVYTGCMLAAWLIQCILSRRLIVSSPNPADYFYLPTSDIEDAVHANTKWYRAAGVLWSIVTVATLPVASAVCGFAAVGITQAHRHGQRPTLRQTLSLADKGWTSPAVIFNLFCRPRQYGTWLLWMGLLLHIMGAIIGPLHQLVVTQDVTKVVGKDSQVATVNDILALTDRSVLGRDDNGDTAALLRSSLTTARPDDSYDKLWQDKNGSSDQKYNDVFDLFMSPVPAKTSTGMVQQYAPRVNSSLQWDSIGADEFPTNCEDGNTFFRNYTAGPDLDPLYGYFFTFSVCMPGNLSYTPLSHTRNRQDFNETLFVTANSNGRESGGNGTFKLTLFTTVGYFELPNEPRDNSVGPLLSTNPLNCTDRECRQQVDDVLASLEGDTGEEYGYLHGKFYLDFVPAKGPLALLTLALFGSGSFIDTSAHNVTASSGADKAIQTVCYDYFPLMFLMGRKTCFSDDDYVNGVASWLGYFVRPSYAVPALSQAAFLANQAIFMQDLEEGPSLNIFHRAHLDSPRPRISTGAMVGLSFLIGFYLLFLLFTCFTAMAQVPWTDCLDSHAIMKLTAALCSTSLPSVEKEASEKDLLDSLPGYVGDAEPDAPIGKLAVGAEAPLRWRRKYETGNGLAL